MKIYKYIHSCVLLEEQGRGLLFDPGVFTFMEGRVKPEKFIDLDAVVVTHMHGDHLDAESLKIIVQNNPQAVVIANSEIVEELKKSNITATILEEGSLRAGVFTVEAVPAPHERTILAHSFPNHAAYRVNGKVIHPGDSLSIETMRVWEGSDVLLFPVTAPWMNEMQAFLFAKALKPKLALPIHDSYVKDFFVKSRHKNYAEFLGQEGINFVSLIEPGDMYELQ